MTFLGGMRLQMAEGRVMASSEEQNLEPSKPRWQPIGPVERRVLGVLIEKAKMTPDYYPMTIAGICSGCNQKSCRWPIMQLEPEDVEEALERLRELGAVGYVQGSGRALKFRHYAYEWFGVNKVELAVLAELLLRGPQTEGQLRAHVSRMKPIADLSELRAVLASLKEKRLVVSLTPETRGHVVSHTLYLPKEMEKLRQEYASEPVETAAFRETMVLGGEISRGRGEVSGEMTGVLCRDTKAGVGISEDTAERVLEEIGQLRQEVAEIRAELARLAAVLSENGSELADLRRRLEQLL